MRDAGQDEGVHAQVHQFVKPLGDLVVVTDQAEGGTGAELVEAAPDVGGGFQVAVAARRIARAELLAAGPADGLAGLLRVAGLADAAAFSPRPAPADLVPRLFLGLPGEDVDPDRELGGFEPARVGVPADG